LSTMAGVPAPVLDSSDVHIGPVDVGPISTDTQPGHSAAAGVTDNTAGDSSRVSRPSDDGVSSAVVPESGEFVEAGAVKRTGTASSQARAIEELVSVKPRNLDPELTTTTPTDDSDRTVPGAYSSDDSGAAEHDGVAALTLSPTSAVLQGASALSNAFNQLGGLDGRPGPAAEAATGVNPPVVAVAAESANPDVFAIVNGTGQSTALVGGGEHAHLLVRPTELAVEAPERTWGDVLSGALHADWDAVDRDLRKVLSRLGKVSDSHDARERVAAWPLWIGVATALFGAQRASREGRRWFQRSVGGVPPAPPGHAVPDAPWPLGPL
jgi:hypothetical protein